MKEKITVETTHTDIREVKTVWEEIEANELLSSGEWLLLHAGCAHKDVMGFQAKPVFILARVGKQ